jgi:acyl-CoA reductase-like NAD-dependent aldehyde dehydrogenase
VTDDAAWIRELAAGTIDAGAALRASTTLERAGWLARSAESLARQAHACSAALSESTGLSVPMVQWAVRTTLGTINEESMVSLVAEAEQRSACVPAPIGLLSVILAGNVFTAPVRSVVVPLLFGVPVLVKASSREELFPVMLRDALRQADARLGGAMNVVVFAGGDAEREAALTESAESVAVYGSDETIAAIAARLSNRLLLAHGHGVSVAYCGSDALSEARIESTIAGLSLDICAYDQRGCLSPQVILVEETPTCSADVFAERLAAEGLEALSTTLPRGPLPVSIGAAQAQWRGLAEIEGTLITGKTHGVAVRAAQPLRWSPGYRNVTVSPVRGLDEVMQALEPLGQSLKCVGADSASLAETQARLTQSGRLHAYACLLGQMQTPGLDAPADGRPIWQGLLRD